ncbi:hypothetical protein MSAN_01382400 [Mycena sanguinolenta]|uniref:BRCT domain-containing protein n=1 Tax=Mycena sanguinolenta TaxID=230812 RepID=A0A8H7D095_9AGAR|nr:hypothetical protein MSAN_01382400 [Mycena sanguinolenta]
MSYWAADSQQIVGSDDTVMIGSCPRPFKNAVVCATGVVDKTSLFKLALELGAASVSAFTDRVTHLVAETHGGAKYLCAVERRIPILTPSWITESHRIWQHGDDVDLAASVAAHRLPIFSGVTLCISGITDIVKRTKINKMLTANGGTYVKALERPVKVTHLLCGAEQTEETDKMRYAEKFNRAGEANPPIQLVWEDWFWDSLEFGGRFDESMYQAHLPRPQPRSTPPFLLLTLNAQIRTRTFPVPSTTTQTTRSLHLYSASPGVTLELWGSLLKPRGYEVDGARGGVVLSPGKAREMESEIELNDVEMRGGEDVQDGNRRNGSVLAGGSFRRANSMQTDVDAGAGPSRGPFRRGGHAIPNAANNNSFIGNLNSLKANFMAANANPTSNAANKNQNAIAGPSFVRAKRLEAPAPAAESAPPRNRTEHRLLRAIEDAGGAVVGRAAEADYIIVRLVSGSALFAAEPSTAARTQYRTECWLERCLFVDRLCAPEEHPTFVPLGVELPVAGADKITMNFSGLDVSEACWERTNVGITLAPVFSRHATHLLCPSGAGPKYTKARQWGVPVVNMEWLAEMAKTGAVPLVDAFLVAPALGVDADNAVPVAEPEPDAGRRRDKGKGKADDSTVQMQDITNSYGLLSSSKMLECEPTSLATDSQESPREAGGPSTGGEGGGFFLPPPPPPRRTTGTEAQFWAAKRVAWEPYNAEPVEKAVEAAIDGVVPAARGARGAPSRSYAEQYSQQRPFNEQQQQHWSATRDDRRKCAREARTSNCGAGNAHGILPRARPVVRLTIPAPPWCKRLTAEDPRPSHKGAAGQHWRAGKRGRAQRSKPQSRHPSDVLPVIAAQDPEQQMKSVFGAGRSFSPGVEDSDAGALEGLSMGADEQSLRVMYEDPGQRAELQRLATLIGEPFEVGGETSSKKRPPRRSARRSGY